MAAAGRSIDEKRRLPSSRHDAGSSCGGRKKTEADTIFNLPTKCPTTS
jgi:hypothetical protein